MSFPQNLDRAGISVGRLAEEVGKSSDTVYRWIRGEAMPSKAERHVINELFQQYFPGNQRTQGEFKFIDLFAGIGGFRVGFESIGGQCVFTSEWDKYSQRTYLRNFQVEEEIHGDITKIPESSIPSHDVLLAGFPCQPFSIAGVSKKAALGRPHGFLDQTQGTLFFDVARIIKHHQPSMFLLENVKNLKSHDKGQTFKVIMQVLEEELGYHVQSRVIDARHWVPQHRERVFILGFRDPVDFQFDLMPLPDSQISPRLSNILHPEDGSEVPEPPYTLEAGRVSDKYTLTSHLWNYLQEYAQKHKERGNGFGFGLVGPGDVARTLSARYYKDGSEILIKRPEGSPRRLTPRECARLMGFDEHPQKPGEPWEIPVSDTQAYRQFGNAVVPSVVKYIASHVSSYIPRVVANTPNVQLVSLNAEGELVFSHA